MQGLSRSSAIAIVIALGAGSLAGAAPRAAVAKSKALSTLRKPVDRRPAETAGATLRVAAARLPVAEAARGVIPGYVVDHQFRGIGLFETLALGSGAIPADMGGASSGKMVMQAVNGGVAVYDPMGTLLKKIITDTDFWHRAGIPNALLINGVSDPRIRYDPASRRFFMSQISVTEPSAENPTGHNEVFIAISKSSDPTEGFKAVSIALKDGVLGDFPTLGIDADAVTVSTNNFGGEGFADLSVFSVPKADLLQDKPSTERLARFDTLPSSDNGAAIGYGFALHPVNSSDRSDKGQTLVAISGTRFNEFVTARLTFSAQKLASLSPARTLPTRFDGTPQLSRQPGPTPYDGGDDRISADVKQVGKYIYVTNVVSKDKGSGVAVSNSVHWAIIDSTTNKVVAERLITDHTGKIDYSYPAIDANGSGRFVIGYNASSKALNISAYATICDFDRATIKVLCSAPKRLFLGLNGNYDLGAPDVRWGDYNVVQLDPVNPKAFWLFQEVPGEVLSDTTGAPFPLWTTVITHLVTK